MRESVKSRIRGLLERTGRMTGTDNVYIARGGFWNALQFTAQTLLSVGTVIAFANLFPREAYGTYKYLLSLAGSLGFLTLSGMDAVITRWVARGQTGVVPEAFRLQLRWNAMAALATGGLAAYYGLHGNAVFAWSLAILAVALPLTAVFGAYDAILVGLKRFDRVAGYTTAIAGVAAAAVIGALLLTDSVVALIAVYAAATLLPTALAYRRTAAGLPREALQDEARAEIRRSGYHLTVVNVLGTLSQYLDKIILFQAAGPAALAGYGFAIAGPDRLKGFAKNWVHITLPRLSERSITDVRHVFYRRTLQALAAGAALALPYILVAPALFRLLLPQYTDAIAYSQVYAASLVFLPAAAYAGNVFRAQDMLRAVYLTSISNQALRIILFLSMGFLWGVWGLVMATLVNAVLGLLITCTIWEYEARRRP